MHYLQIKNIFLGVFILFSALILRGQDGKTTIELERGEVYQYSFYAKSNGLWAVTHHKYHQNTKIYKYSPDLSKQEWTLKIGALEPKAIYDEKHPDYIYFRSIAATTWGEYPIRFYQINKTGQLKTYETKKEKDEDVKKDIIAFTSMNHFCELWTKKKSDNELVLILRDNETFTKSKKIISIPDVNPKADYSYWYYAGSNDNIVALTRHETIKKETTIHVVRIDMKTGSVVNHFSYKPTLKDPSAKILDNFTQRNGTNAVLFNTFPVATMTALNGAGTYPSVENIFNTYGDIRLSQDGKRFYYYGLINSDNREINSIQFEWAKLDLDGTKLLQKEFTVTDKDLELTDRALKGSRLLAESIVTRFALEERDNQVKLSVKLNKKDDITNISLAFDIDGREVGKWIKENPMRSVLGMLGDGGITITKDAPENLLLDFPEANRIQDYLKTKKTKGFYSILSDKDQHVLTVHMPKENAVGFIYFNK